MAYLKVPPFRVQNILLADCRHLSIVDFSCSYIKIRKKPFDKELPTFSDLVICVDFEILPSFSVNVKSALTCSANACSACLRLKHYDLTSEIVVGSTRNG